MAIRLYLIEDGEYTKIGVSDNPKKRLLDLQVGNPRPLKLVTVIEYKCDRTAYLVEQCLHGFWGDCRACGEWFNVSVEDILGCLPFSQVEALAILRKEQREEKAKVEKRVDEIGRLSKQLKKLRAVS